MSSREDSDSVAASQATDGGTTTTCSLKLSSATILPIRTAKQSTKSVEQEHPGADSLQEPSNNLGAVKYMRILDIYKKLGIGKYVDLPKIVLAGLTQCGKSSIIENLTSYPVQYGSELKTQFPIEFTLIDDPKMAYIKATIILDPNCVNLSPEALERVRAFNIDHARSPIMTKGEFKRLLTETSKILTISPTELQSCSHSGQSLESIQSSTHKISSHTLRLVMRGPRDINFSIIDTPGVSPDCLEDSSSDCDGAIQLVLPLIKQSRTIIAAAFEANTIKSPQKMFSWMRSADHQGRRTIGIMTKCDELGPGLLKKTAKEMFAPTQPESISNNRFIPACGSYGVRNKTTWDSILYTSLEGVREREAALFGRKDWCSNASDWQIRLGIHELVLGLNKIFANHVRTQYASVAAEIRVILAQRRERLNLLGPVNKTIVEQREYLRSVVTNSHVAILRCLHDDSNLIIPNGPDLLPGKRIALQKIAFENLLSAKEGHFAFHSATGESDFASGHAASAVVTPQDQTGDIYTWINRRYQSMKGSTLPGVVPYPLIDSLFQEQTANWKAITTEFVDSIENILLKTVQQCLGDTCHNKAVLARLTELALQRTTVKIDLWRKSCHSILQNGQQRLDLLSHESEFIQEVNTARTLRFLSALTSMESVDEALDIPVAPVFGPLLRTKKPVRPQSKSESPASSLSSGSSPRTPQSIRSYDVFDDDPLYDSDANEEPDSEWKIFNLDDNKRNWDSPHFRMRCLKVRPLRISSWTSTAGTEYIRRAQDIITNDRQVVYQIHDILKAYYNISLRNYIASIFKTLQSDLSEVVGSFSEFVDSLSDEKISRLFEESDVDKRARKSLEEDIQRLQLAVLEAEVILTEPTSGSSSNQSHPRDE